MSAVIQKKIRNFLDARSELLARYNSLAASADPRLRLALENLHEFDLLSFSYLAIKSYYDLSKLRWDLDYRNLLDDFVSLSARIETKLPLTELYLEIPGLQILRRQFRENAREGGKVAYLMVSLLGRMSDMATVVAQVASYDTRKPLVDSESRVELTELASDISHTTHKQKNTSREENAQRQNLKVAQLTPLGEGDAVDQASESVQAKADVTNTAQSTRQEETIAYTQTQAFQAGKPAEAQIDSLNHAQAHTQAYTQAQAQAQAQAHTQAYTQAQAQAQTQAHTQAYTQAHTQAQNHPTLHVQAQANGNVQAAPVHTMATVPANANNGTSGSSRIQVPSQAQPSAHTHPGVETVYQPPHLYTQQVYMPQYGSAPQFRAQSPTGQAAKETERQPKRPSPIPPYMAKRAMGDTSFDHFSTWTREHAQCIFAAAVANPRTATIAIQNALRNTFGVMISPEAANTLRLHYGMIPATAEHFKYYIQTFHLVASQFYENRHKYVTVPWADFRTQFMRKTGYRLEDWEVRGRWGLYLLHRRVYGARGEPPSNYNDLAERFRGLVREVGLQPLEFSPDPVVESLWTPDMVALLVEAQLQVPPNLSNRLLVIRHYLRLKSGRDVDLDSLAETLLRKDVVAAVQQRLTQRVAPFNQQPPAQPPAQHPAQHPAQPHSVGIQQSVVDLLQQQVANPNVPPGVLVDLSTVTRTPPPATNAFHQSSAQHNMSASPQSNNTLQVQVPLQPTTVARAEKRAGHFDELRKQIHALMHPDWYYRQKLAKADLTEFWTYSKCKTIVATVELISKFPADTTNVTHQVCRTNLFKIIMWMLLREDMIRVLVELIETRLVRMMEADVFDAALCLLINNNFKKT